MTFYKYICNMLRKHTYMYILYIVEIPFINKRIYMSFKHMIVKHVSAHGWNCLRANSRRL